MAQLWATCLDRNFKLPNIENHGWLDSWAKQKVQVFPEDYRDCLNMDVKEIAYVTDTETNFESDDDNIWIWMFLFDMNLLSYGS